MVRLPRQPDANADRRECEQIEACRSRVCCSLSLAKKGGGGKGFTELPIRRECSPQKPWQTRGGSSTFEEKDAAAIGTSSNHRQQGGPRAVCWARRLKTGATRRW